MTADPVAQTPQTRPASRHPVGQPDRAVATVGARFLRLRPWLVGAALCVAAHQLMSAALPATQRLTLGATLGFMEALFIAEAAIMRRRAPSPRWFHASLLTTIAGVTGACAASGQLQSPLLPLLLAPAVVGFAAFGATARSHTLLIALVAALVALSAMPQPTAFAPLPLAPAAVMRAVAMTLTLSLLFAGVAGLVQAHADSARLLAQTSAAMIEATRLHSRELEAIGAQVAHELKNPLAAVKGLAQLVERAQDLPPRHLPRLNMMSAELSRMETLLQTYLSAARPLGGALLTPCDARRCVEGLDALAAPSPPISISAADAPLTVRADLAQLRGALLNLLLNAQQAGEGPVTLQIAAEADGVAFIVTDRGVGMSPEQQARYGRPQPSDKPAGSGLGVFIARTVAEQHGGALELRHSAPGLGTCVALWLPAARGLS